MQMIHNSLMPEALSKFLREEALRPAEPLFVTDLSDAEQTKSVHAEQARLNKLQAELSAKHDRDAEASDRAAFAKRKAMETAR